MKEELPYEATLREAGKSGLVPHREDIYGSGPPVDVVHPELLEFITGVCGRRVLDIGCGVGAYVRELNARGSSCLGVEMNPEFATGAEALGRPVFVMDGRALAFSDAAFDTCLLIEVIEHIDDFELVLQEAARVARRNLVISVPNVSAIPVLSKHNVVPWHMLEGTHVNFFTPEILQQVLDRLFTGRAKVQVEEYAPFFPWEPEVQLYYQIRATVELAS